MPTLIGLDGFAHQSTANGTGAGHTFIGVYDGVVGTPTFDTSVKRLTGHVCSLKLVMDGVTAQGVARNFTGGSGRVVVYSFYIRLTAAPSVTSQLFRTVGGAQAKLVVLTDGKLRMDLGSGGSEQTTSGSIADSNWHRIDFRVDHSTSTFTVDWQVDGVAQTQSVRASQTPGDATGWNIGCQGSPTHTATVWYNDFVVSVTSGDYPIGPHHVFPLYPNADGTHVIGSTNALRDDSNNTTNLYQVIDDWNGGTPSTANFIHYTSTTTGDAASNYAECAYTDPYEHEVWDVITILAGFANGTGADTADLRWYTAGGTLIDSTGLQDYSISTTVLGYYRKVSARPSGGWTPSNLSGILTRWGYSTDTNAIPRLSAVMLEYAAPDNASITTTTVAAVAAVPTPTVSAEASVTTTTVARAAAIPTPDIEAESAVDADITPTPVAVAAALDTPITTGEARAPPATVEAVAAVPAPGIETSSDAAVTTTTVAVAAAIPAPTVEAQANAAVTTTTVEVAAVIDATASVDVAITVTTVAVLQGEPGAYISIDAFVEFRDAPENLLAVPVSTTQIDLSWDAVVGASVYDIERDGSVIVTSLPALTYSDTGLAPNTTHYYRVRAAG